MGAIGLETGSELGWMDSNTGSLIATKACSEMTTLSHCKIIYNSVHNVSTGARKEDQGMLKHF